MASDLDDLADPERRLCEALAAYFDAVKAGQAPERDAWLARYPELAGELVAFLEQQERLLRVTEPLRGCGPAGLRCDRTAFTNFGGYELQGEIARGGMGVVFQARQRRPNRPVALKMLRGGPLADQDDLRRFHLEAEVIARLDHPNIVPIYEVGEHEGFYYFAMRLLNGQTLAALLHARPDPKQDLPRFLAIFEQVCQTIAYAHSRGVIHRDLKPSNVMVGSFGEVQVMDWGLAKVLPEGGIADDAAPDPDQQGVVPTERCGSAVTGGESQAGSVLGTPAYMAPEQARGEVGRLDERADVFGLGAILCEILTGRPPYTGSTREEISAARRGATWPTH